MLYAHDVPDFGGDTAFANQVLAYQEMSKGLQSTIDTLHALHSAGSLCKRLGIEEGRVFEEQPILEFFYKSDPLGDPMINECHVDIFGWATKEEVEILKSEGLKINKGRYIYIYRYPRICPYIPC